MWKNLLEPHIPDLHTFSIHLSNVARFSYLFNLLLRIGQICILFQSPCQNLPDCHTFSIFSKFGRLALVNWAKLKKFQNLILDCLISSEPERAAEARRAVVASVYSILIHLTAIQSFVKTFIHDICWASLSFDNQSTEEYWKDFTLNEQHIGLWGIHNIRTTKLSQTL